MSQFISVKKERQQTNKHALLAIMLCLLLLSSSFTFVFADELPTFEECFSYSSPGYNNGTTYDITSNSLICNLKMTNYNGQAEFRLLNSDVQQYEFDVTFSSTNFNSSGSNSLRQVFWTAGHGEITNAVNCTQSGSSVYATASSGSFHYKQTTLASNANNSARFYVSIFDNTKLENDVEYSFSNFTIDGQNISLGGGGITNNGNAIIVVNPGNAAYIGYDSATFNFLINLSKPVSSLNSNARYGFATELPSGVLTFTPSSGNSLPLRKSIPDLLGRSATWVGSVDTDTIGYFVVYNPVYDLNGNTNPPIRVTVTVGYMNVTQFPLTATDIGGDLVSSGNSDNFYISDGMQGGTDLPNYIYSQTDQNGNVTTSSALTVPVTPYNYTAPSASSAESGLQGFLQQILDLLSAPIKHIQNLYNSAVGFFNYLTSLWSWLPPEVTTIIGSALAVLVVIGVVKFLWK